ncbi:uncharacterized protein LOC106080652 isoform X1 [Stomoxys calcitrans]|uniref:uncharacterized protein LOC106080652 isoform X1 n=2 Tax=Stomoxys calcitrans TaxID=35570 RepID=UPI0027E298CE|nr:uncharacterized protein LOC106080652 isoform X1 [Stomoxys calcitrans]
MSEASGAGSSLMEKSADEMLDDVAVFIDSVCRDLNIVSPPTTNRRTVYQNTSPIYHAVSSPETTPPPTATAVASAGGASGSDLSDSYNAFADNLTSRRPNANHNSLLERIDRICNSVDQNLRSIGIYIHPEETSPNRGENDGSNISSVPHRQPKQNIIRPRRANLNQAMIEETPADATPPTTSSNVRNETNRSRRPNLNQATLQATPTNGNFYTTRIVHDHTPIVVANETVSDAARPLPNEIILAEDDDDDDDVVVVHSNLPPVIDLCTPSDSHRRTVFNRPELPRRQLEANDTEVEIVPVRRRRISRSNAVEPQPTITTSSGGEITESHTTSDSSEPAPYVCPVCLECCFKRRPTATKCGHIYCEECIRQAIRLTHKCPMCKAKINCSQLTRLYI